MGHDLTGNHAPKQAEGFTGTGDQLDVHEFSVVRSLLAQVEQIVAEQGGGVVEEIRIRCGALAGVEPELIAEAFDFLRVDSPWQFTALRIAIEPVLASCEDCGATFEPLGFRFVCSTCGSQQVRERSGDRVIIESLSVRTADPNPRERAWRAE